LTIAETITRAAQQLAEAGIPTARLDAELLLRNILSKDRAFIFTHGNDALSNGQDALFEKDVRRRITREPLQYIIGRQEFWGLDFFVAPGVLIPRPETELVVEAAIKATEGYASPLIIDLCTGSGCIAVSLAKELSRGRIFASDQSEKALSVARRNAQNHGVSDRIRFLEGDLFGPLQELDVRGKVDIITANPPYVKSADLDGLQPEVRDYEPEMALVAGPEGTEIADRIIRAAPEYLRKNGVLIMEMGIGQAETLMRMVSETGAYQAPEVLKDLAGIERVIIAAKK
jgi:release factor glutamine methyltransferase